MHYSMIFDETFVRFSNKIGAIVRDDGVWNLNIENILDFLFATVWLAIVLISSTMKYLKN